MKSNPFESMKRKLSSFLVSALLYAVAGYAFFLVFFRSQF
jgi:hypothetical protein